VIMFLFASCTFQVLSPECLRIAVLHMSHLSSGSLRIFHFDFNHISCPPCRLTWFMFIVLSWLSAVCQGLARTHSDIIRKGNQHKVERRQQQFSFPVDTCHIHKWMKCQKHNWDGKTHEKLWCHGVTQGVTVYLLI